MRDFPLIKSLKDPDDKTRIPIGHKYSEYPIIVEGNKTIVHIPVKETETFENATKDIENIDKYSFNKIIITDRHTVA